MLMTRNAPRTGLWGELSRLQDEMNRLFDSYGFDGSWPTFSITFPAVNVWQDGETVFAEAELPGMELNDLEIYVTGGNQLTIRGERKQPSLAKGVWHRQERSFGTFARVIGLPVDVDPDKVEARFNGGVLTVTMPKSETAKPRKITVKTE